MASGAAADIGSSLLKYLVYPTAIAAGILLAPVAAIAVPIGLAYYAITDACGSQAAATTPAPPPLPPTSPRRQTLRIPVHPI